MVVKTAFSWFPWLLLAAGLPCGAPAGITIDPWTPIFKGVLFATGQADTNEVRVQKVSAVRIDLWDANVEFFSTPSNGDALRETYGQTTTAFVNSYGVKLGVNANFFSPVSTTPNEPRDLDDLAVSQGDIVSPASGARVLLLISRGNQVTLTKTPPASYTNIWTAVAGSDMILVNGVPQLAGCTTSFCGPNPRTAVGLSQNGRYLYLMILDGRQPGWSDGATLLETGQWLLRLGAWNGVNLDGGGSSAMAKIESGAAVLLNRPAGGVQRVNGNHLGLFTRDIAPVLSEGPASQTVLIGTNVTLSAKAGGTTPLRYQWRWNGTNLLGATKDNYVINNVQAAQAGSFTVVISNAVGAVTSAPAILNAHYALAAPYVTGGAIARVPDQASYAPGTTVTLSPQPDPGFSFAGWSGAIQGRGTPQAVVMNGHKTVAAAFLGQPSEIILDNTNASLTGAWTAYANPGDGYGGNFYDAPAVPTTSVPTHLAVYRPNIFTPGKYAVYLWHPTDATRSTKAPWTVGFDVGTASTTVNQSTSGGQWRLVFPGKNFLRGSNGFVRVSNNAGGSGQVVADAVKIAFGTAPEIVTPPADQAALEGEPCGLAVVAAGSEPLAYQWRFNGMEVPGAEGADLSFHGLRAAQAGNYEVVITNHFGSITSRVAKVIMGYRLDTFGTIGGHLMKAPEQPGYQPGASVVLSAQADPGFVFTGWAGDASGTKNPMTVFMTNHQTIAAQFTGAVADIILDSVEAEFWGAWIAGTSAAGRYGTNYHFADTAGGSATARATYRPMIKTPGFYDVYIWYPQGSNRALNAPWLITWDGGSEVIYWNQQSNGGGWRLLASSKPFARGTNGCVSLSNATGTSGSVVIADGVRLAFVYPDTRPPSIQPALAQGSGGLELRISGTPRTMCWIESSPDLVGWRMETNWPNFDGSFKVVQPLSANSGRQFYRVRCAP